MPEKMSIRRLALSFVLCLSLAASAQAADEPLPRTERAGGPGRDVRSAGDYPFPSISRTRRDMQNLTHAMQLREYCADASIPDAFLVAQLARFSRITGREENCRTLLDY